MASVLGFVRRCLPARAAAALASSLYFLQGTLQKIHLHRLLGEQALELKDFLSVGRRMGTRARCFFAWFSRFKLSAPLVEASSGYPELLSQLIHALASPHPFYGHALELPGISLSSLHSRFLSRRVCPSRVCQFKGSVQLIVMIQQQIAILASDSREIVRKRIPVSTKTENPAGRLKSLVTYNLSAPKLGCPHRLPEPNEKRPQIEALVDPVDEGDCYREALAFYCRMIDSASGSPTLWKSKAVYCRLSVGEHLLAIAATPRISDDGSARARAKWRVAISRIWT